MWRFRVKMLRGAPLSKADASLKLSLERLEQAQPAQAGPEEGRDPPPVSTEPVGKAAAENSLTIPRGSLFTSSAEVFEGAEPVAETSDVPSPLAADPPNPPPAPGPSPTSSPAPAPSQQPAAVDPTATPPNLSASTHLIREEQSQEPQAGRGPGISRFKFGVAVAMSALISALLTSSLVDRAPPARPPSPRLNELAQRIANQKLAAGRGELERREGLVTDDEERLLEELEVLVRGNEELARQHERSFKRARNMETSLNAFAGRAADLSRSGQPASLRDHAAALEAEARGYLTALGQMAEQLDTERQAAGERALRLRDHLDHRPLRGRRVRVIHDPLRTEDATRVVELLNALEMEAQLFNAEVANPTIHKGRLFYSKDEEEAAAHHIARLVESLEEVEPEKIGVASPYMSLWIVGEPF